MENHTVSSASSFLLPPEILWIEPEHYERANEQVETASRHLQRESYQWKAYINSLGLFAFESWAKANLHTADIQPIAGEATVVRYLNIEGFKICIITTEHVLDEVVQFPESIVCQPSLAAHLYVVLEVLEDQQQVMIRGFLRYDELAARLTLRSQQSTTADSEPCRLPLSLWDEEINHLLSYVQHSHPSCISLPQVIAQEREATTPEATTSSSTLTRLSQWLEDSLTEGWQTIDRLISPQANLAWNARQNTSGIKGGKLINLGVQLDQHLVALIVTAIPEGEKIGINVQVLPTGDALLLPPHLTVTLRSSADKVLQTVTARAHDNYIQLRPFRGAPGIRFAIEVTLNDVKVNERFEL